MTTLTPAQIAGYASAAGFTAAQVPIMTAIALAESSGNTDATHNNTNGSTDYGLWQINGSANADVIRTGVWSNPADNARMAFAIWKRQGYSAWSVFKSGSYAKHLGAATAGAGNPVTLPILNIPNPVDGFAALINPHTYLRVAMFLGGSVLLGMGLVLMGIDAVPDSLKNAASSSVKSAAKGSKVAQTVVKTATKGK